MSNDALPAPTDELASVRGVAKEWLAATMTLFGLLSFSAIFFGAETLKAFKDHDEWRAVAFAWLLGVAVLAASLCTFFGTRAAHGWPPRLVVANRKTATAKESPRSAKQKIDQARRDLKTAMYIAGFAVLLILGAVLLVFNTQLTQPASLTVKVLTPGNIENVLVCGKYASADTKGITVTNKDGGLVTKPWAEVGKVNPVRSC